jgi:glycosyltransferase involved in cell wall biosynthesis
VPSLRLLVVTYFYPPDESVGSHRWPAMARYLRRLGHEVTILTTSAFGMLPDDDPWVVRTRDLQGAGALRRLLGRPATMAATSAAAPAAPAPRILTHGLVPDAHVASWLPFAIPAARRAVRERRIDCVVTNSPTDSTHLLGLALGRRRPAWVLDLEDGWRFEPLRDDWPTTLQTRLDDALERRVARAADMAVGLAEPIAHDLSERYGIPAAYVPNGWDPDLEEDVAAASPPALEPGTFSLFHPGGLTHAVRRDPGPLFAAVGALLREAPEQARRLRIVLAGRLTTGDAELLDGLPDDVRALVRHLGPLARSEAVALERRADALLMVVSGSHRSQVTGKLFEYLAADRPILALADANEAARIVRETRTGLVVPSDDVPAIVGALRSALSGELAAAYAPRGVGAYRFPGPAEAMARTIENAIARRRG